MKNMLHYLWAAIVTLFVMYVLEPLTWGFHYVLTSDAGVVILSNQNTGNIEQAQRKVDMADKIYLLEPEEAPFTALVRKLAKKDAISPKVEWMEDENVPAVDQINNAAGYLATDTVLTVDNGNYFVPGDIVKVFKTGETMRVTAQTATTITVTRSWGATAAAALADNDFLYIMGTAMAEGGLAAQARMTKKVPKFNYLEIFKTTVKISKTLQASGLYGVSDNERDYQRRKKAIEHNRAIERAFWFGEKNEDLSGADPIRSTGGVFEFIATNKTTLANEAAFTNSELDKFFETLFLVGSQRRWAFVSPLILRLINAFAQSKIQIQQLELGQQDGVTYGIKVSRYQSPHGEVMLVNNRIFKDYRTAGNFAGKVMVAVDFDTDDGAAYRYLKTRDTHLNTDIQANEADFIQDEYLSECGLQLAQEKRHGILEING